MMNNQSPYQRARERAVTKLGFYKHFAVYFLVMLLLIAINMTTSPEYHWYIWPMMGWGLAVAIHAFKAFMGSSEDTVLERMTEKELQEDQNRPQSS